MNGIRILIVEDEAITAMDIQQSLQELGYIVPATTNSGLEAIALAKDIRPDLILMDIVLKGEMDGTEAAAYISQHLQIPIIFLTAYRDDKTFARAKLSSPCSYLTKPYDLNELNMAIKFALYKYDIKLKLADNEVKFHDAFDDATIGVALVDLQDKFICINRFFCKMLGFTNDELLHLSLNDISHPDDKNLEITLFKQLMKSEIESFKLGKRYVKNDGGFVFCNVSVTLIKDDKDLPLYFMLKAQEVTAREASEKELI
jgi:PAS domain S-box-containing protein